MAQQNQVMLYQNTVFGELTPEDVKTVHETIAKECNESQFRLFMGIAKAAGANPILGEIHPSVFQGKLTTQFGIDFYVRKAKETEGYRGYDVQLVHEHDDFEMHQELSKDGRYFIAIDKHRFGFPRGKVIGGYAFAYKEGFEPFSVIMEVSEVEHYQRSQIGMQKRMWTDQFNDMFKKHMVKRVLKAAFGLTFENEEREAASYSAENVPAYEPQRRDITAEAEAMATEQRQKQAPDGEDSGNEQESKLQEARQQMAVKFQALGITDPEEMGKYIAQHAKPKGKKPTLAEMMGLLKIMDMHIEEKKAAEADNSGDDLLDDELMAALE
ncbi:RecT family recombinase [Paenibacillus ehimensis]|uniref:RecT family recombinase n=1 Tax=Paenibacillus ehimensis TaxID=79264 RepID=A0ABT8VI86_9BACL|nr:RecT family recombinase [Paenibacillus ehimensis]MDO3680675.1 RecT family recombinase [Paenibacillus ehimensis]